MKIKLSQAAHLGGLDHKPGVHELPDHVASEWFFLALKTNGKILILEAPAEVEVVEAIEDEATKAPSEDEPKVEESKKTKKKKNRG